MYENERRASNVFDRTFVTINESQEEIDYDDDFGSTELFAQSPKLKQTGRFKKQNTGLSLNETFVGSYMKVDHEEDLKLEREMLFFNDETLRISSK